MRREDVIPLLVALWLNERSSIYADKIALERRDRVSSVWDLNINIFGSEGYRVRNYSGRSKISSLAGELVEKHNTFGLEERSNAELVSNFLWDIYAPRVGLRLTKDKISTNVRIDTTRVGHEGALIDRAIQLEFWWSTP